MKNDFSPQEFINMLEGTTEIIKVTVNSKQFQELTNDIHYSNVDFTLVDAIQAFEQAVDAYKESLGIKE
ncbi:hypothetical protein [Calothrix rhizosoleniae]|uniref:hypothetical protein n=1 Tax=Calothrix rhizosoleniae TaxID=888997 RepID=UPI000B4A5292|nr:hypothetical protein [Calothrix rhizosoleniae]